MNTSAVEKQIREPNHEAIAKRAYFQWLAGGKVQGEDWKYWFTAETELMQQQLGRIGIVWARNTEELEQGLKKMGDSRQLKNPGKKWGWS